MNNGVDSGMEKTITDEPKEISIESKERYSSLQFAMSRAPRPKSTKRTTRYYRVIRTKDGVSAIQTGIAANLAGRLKNRYHEQGYKVDLIEESSLSGVVIRTPDPIGNIPCPTPYQTSRQKVQAQVISNKLSSFRAAKASYANERATKTQETSKVYDKASGALVFSGEVNSAIDFVIKRMENGIWQMGDWVLYIPSKIWEALGGLVNA